MTLAQRMHSVSILPQPEVTPVPLGSQEVSQEDGNTIQRRNDITNSSQSREQASLPRQSENHRISFSNNNVTSHQQESRGTRVSAE